MIAGSHTGRLIGSVLPKSGPLALPALPYSSSPSCSFPFAVDANRDRIDRRYLALVGEKE